MKHEWRKKEKAIYLPKSKPEFIEVPSYKYITVKGEGSPDSEDFASCIGVLYSLSYAIKMTRKKEFSEHEGFLDYTVYPLEGIWDLNEEAKKTFDGTINREDFVYTLMIRQPDFIDEAFYQRMLENTKSKKPHEFLQKVKFEQICDGNCVQMLHLGSFENEPESFELMEAFAGNENMTRISKLHREIYLSDFRKVPVEKLKTVLRFKVEKDV